MAYSNKKNYGCLKAFLFAVFVLSMAGYAFTKIAPKTAQNAKEEVLGRIFGTDTIQADTTVVDSVVVVDADTVPECIDSLVSIPIENDGNATYIVCKVNGIDVRFMIDTGCDGVQMTHADYAYMLNMKAANDSSLLANTTHQCIYADGSTDTCQVMKADSVDVGGIIVKNVEVTLANSLTAPRLLGQSVLRKLGTVSFDYKNKKLKIERDNAQLSEVEILR